MTETGKQLARDMEHYWTLVREATPKGWCPPLAPEFDIAVIEAEAVVVRSAEIADAVRTMDGEEGAADPNDDPWVDRAAVLAIVERNAGA